MISIVTTHLAQLKENRFPINSLFEVPFGGRGRK